MPSVSYDLQRVEVRNAISREDWVVVKAPSRRKLARDMAAAAEQSDETKRIAEILHAFVDGPLRRAREGSAITSQVSVIPMRSDASSERASATAPPGHWQPSEVVAGGDAIAKELWGTKPKERATSTKVKAWKSLTRSPAFAGFKNSERQLVCTWLLRRRPRLALAVFWEVQLRLHKASEPFSDGLVAADLTCADLKATLEVANVAAIDLELKASEGFTPPPNASLETKACLAKKRNDAVLTRIFSMYAYLLALNLPASLLTCASLLLSRCTQ